MSYDLIALGETMLALAPAPGETLQSAATLQVDHAGAESNTCVGLARLGLRVAWISRLGDDPPGDRILAALKAENVDTRWVMRDAQRPTGLMLKDPVKGGVLYYRSGSAASVLAPSDLADVPLASARALLVTGVTTLIGPEPGQAARAALGAARGLRVVDPNLRRGLWGSDRRAELVLPLLQDCDLVLGGEHELAELLGDAEPERLARRCVERGSAREVVVRCADRLGVLDQEGRWHELPTPRSASVDPIGAGDAFNAGYIAVRLAGGAPLAALRAGARCGAGVARQLGDTAGFPTSLAELA
jgi:2-dehydro-3-deoxygluconokinase